MSPRSVIRMSAGRTNIRVDETGSAAELTRGMNMAFKELASNFDWFCGQLEDFLPEDLRDGLEPTFEKSQEYCPKKTGALVASGFLEVESFRGGARVEIGYARNNDPSYAVYVHEMVDYTHVAPTRAKWLQQAVDEDYFQILQRVTDNVRARVGD